jgi:outer membrane protein OmpA-like peptidoglycan-associated protein
MRLAAAALSNRGVFHRAATSPGDFRKGENMSINLVDMISRQLSPSLVRQIGSAAGSDEASTMRGASTAVPVLVGGLAQHSRSETGLANLMKWFTDPQFENLTNNYDATLGDAASRSTVSALGGGMVGRLFGDRLSGLLQLISGQTGLSTGTSSALLSMLAPFALGIIGRHVRTERLDARGVSSLLASQAPYAASVLPSSIGRYVGVVPERGARVVTAGTEEERKRAGLLGALAIAGLCVAGYAAYKALHRATPPSVALYTPKTAKGIPTMPAVPAPYIAARPIGGGPGVAAAPRAGDLNALRSWLSSGASGSFRLDALEFEFDSTDLAANSAAVPPRLAALLREYPRARVQLSGNTDSIGGTDYNTELSQRRADSIAQSLSANGVDAGRIQERGQSFDRPLATNDTEQGRARNRRVDVFISNAP